MVWTRKSVQKLENLKLRLGLQVVGLQNDQHGDWLGVLEEEVLGPCDLADGGIALRLLQLNLFFKEIEKTGLPEIEKELGLEEISRNLTIVGRLEKMEEICYGSVGPVSGRLQGREWWCVYEKGNWRGGWSTQHLFVWFPN